MKYEKINVGIIGKILVIFCDIVPVGLVINIIRSFNFSNFGSIIAVFLFCALFFVLTFYIFTEYLIFDNKIIIKHPLIKEREFNLEHLIGFSYRESAEPFGEFVIYFINNKISITVNNSKSNNIVNNFIKKYYEKVKNSNINKIINNNIEIDYKKNKIIIFYKDKMEIYNGNLVNKILYYSNNFEKCYLRRNALENDLILITSENKKIILRNTKCKGGIGIYNYLMENIKCETGA